jgi:23S rRNA (guanosine2251-2'-O)-methyltransferase
MSDRDRKPPFRRGGGKPFEKGRKFARPPGRRDRDTSSDGPVILYGWHTVTAALANPERQIRKLFLTENAARRLSDENIDTRVPPEIVRPNLIDQRLGPDAVHQGLLAETEPLPSPDIDTLPQQGIVLVLDQITDPHNVGAIMRGQGDRHHGPPQPGGDRRAGEIRVRRTRTGAAGISAKSGPRADRTERPRLHDGRAGQ